MECAPDGEEVEGRGRSISQGSKCFHGVIRPPNRPFSYPLHRTTVECGTLPSGDTGKKMCFIFLRLEGMPLAIR